MLHHGRVMHLLAEAVLNRGVTVESPHCQHTDNVYAVYSGRGAQGRGGPCFNMSRRSECSDIPALECVIGLEIHVTHFQRLVRELHSEHISPLKKKKKNQGPKGSSYTRYFLFLFFCFTPRGKCFTCRQTDVCLHQFV